VSNTQNQYLYTSCIHQLAQETWHLYNTLLTKLVSFQGSVHNCRTLNDPYNNSSEFGITQWEITWLNNSSNILDQELYSLKNTLNKTIKSKNTRRVQDLFYLQKQLNKNTISQWYFKLLTEKHETHDLPILVHTSTVTSYIHTNTISLYTHHEFSLNVTNQFN